MKTFDINNFRAALASGFIQWRKHTLQRIAERNIKQRDVIRVLQQGEIIRNYTDDKPFPSALFSGRIKADNCTLSQLMMKWKSRFISSLFMNPHYNILNWILKQGKKDENKTR